MFPNIGEERLILVKGPAGTGKTTAVTQWLRHVSPSTAGSVWVSLRDGDRDRMGFWATVVSAVQRAQLAPDDSKLRFFTPDSLSSTRLTNVLQDALSTIRSPFIIAIDDYHHALSPEIDSDCLTLLTALPQLTLVLTTRLPSGLRSSEVTARIDVRRVNSDCFAFSLDETKQLATKLGAHYEVATRIHEQVDGWPLATMAMLIEHIESPNVAIGKATDHSEFIEDYVSTLLAHANEDKRMILLGTSLADDFTLSVAAKAVRKSEDEVKNMLRDLEWSGVTTRRRIGADTRFQHHPAIRDQLQIHAYKTLEPTELTRISNLHAEDLEDQQPHAALQILCQVHDYHKANEMFLRHFSRLTTVHAVSSLNVLRTIPIEEFRLYPGMVAGRLLIESVDPSVPPTQLMQWSSLIREATTQRWQSGVQPGASEIALNIGSERMIGNGEIAAELASELRKKLAYPEGLELENLTTSVPFMHALIALTDLLDGAPDLAMTHFSHCARTGKKLGMPFEELRGLNGQALVAAVDGDIAHTTKLAEEANSTNIPESWGHYFGGVNLRLARAIISIESFDVSTSRSEMDVLAGAESMLETWPYFAMVTAHIILIERGPKSAAMYLTTAIERNSSRRVPVKQMQQSLTSMLARLSVRSGQITRAHKLLATTQSNHPEVLLARSELALFEKKWLTAISTATQLIDPIRLIRYPSKRTIVSAYVIRGSSYWRHNQRMAARSDFEVAVSMMEKYRLKLPLITVPKDIVDGLLTDEAFRGRENLANLMTSLPVQLHGFSPDLLTDQERQVLPLLMNGKTVEQVSQELFVSANTVKFHIKRIYRKLGVSSRKSAISRAYELGLTDIP